MDILKLNKFKSLLLITFVVSLFFACQSEESVKRKYERAEKECRKKNSIDRLHINFLGYSYDEVSEISAEIRGTQRKKFNFMVSEKILDSIRKLRAYTINQEINLKDTIILIFPNKERFVLTDFKYIVRPHFGMMNKNFGCDFYEMKINNIIEEGGSANFIKKGFEIE